MRLGNALFAAKQSCSAWRARSCLLIDSFRRCLPRASGLAACFGFLGWSLAEIWRVLSGGGWNLADLASWWAAAAAAAGDSRVWRYRVEFGGRWVSQLLEWYRLK